MIYMFKNYFVNVLCCIVLQWVYEIVIFDLDGSFMGFVRGSVVLINDNFFLQYCNVLVEYSYGFYSGSICDGSVKFRRFVFNNVKLLFLLGKIVLFINSYGIDEVFFCFKCVIYLNGWLMMVIVGDNYIIIFEIVEQIINIIYFVLFYDLEMEDYVWISYNFI